MLFFLTFYVFKRGLATYIERKRLEEAVTVHEKKHETKSRGFSREKKPRGVLSITPRAIARGVIDSTTRTHGIHEHCKMYARDGTREKTRDEVEGFFERKKTRGVLSITPRAIARGVIDSTTRTHGINEHCKM